MGAQLPNEEKEAPSAQVNPNSADMESTPPAKESVVDDFGLLEASSTEAISTERRETLNIRENEAAHGLAVAVETKGDGEAIEEDCSMLKKDGDDKKVTPPEAMEVSKACPQTEDAETHNVEAATSHEAAKPQYENTEITLVVEMNTDAEMIVESGAKGEEIMQEEADISVERGASFQVVEQVDALQNKEEGMGTSPAVKYEHTETTITENIPQEGMGKVQTADQEIGPSEPAASDMLVEVETHTLAFNRGVRDGEDETKLLERKREEGHTLAEAQIREDAERPCIGEDAGTSTGELEAKAEGILNKASGLPDGVENDKGGRKGEAGGGCMEIVVEAGDTEKGYMVMEVETEANTRTCANEVSAGITDGEREKDGTAGQEPAGLEGSNGIAEEMVDINRKDQESGSATPLLENEVVQAGSLQNFKGRDGVREGIERVEGTIVPTEALRNKEAIKVEEPGSTPTGMDSSTNVSEKQRMNVNIFQHMESDLEERSKQGMIFKHSESDSVERAKQEMHRETEADTSDIVPLQHHLDVERGPQLGFKEDKYHQLLERNNESGKEVGREVLADHIALHTNKDMSTEVDSGKVELGDGRKEEAPGQDLQDSSAIQSPLQNLKSKNLAFETSCSEGDRRVQRERQQNRQVHTEMQIRLLPDKSVKADLIKSHEGGSGMRMLKELPFAKSKETSDEELVTSVGQHWRVGIVMQVKAKADTFVEERPKDTKMREIGFEQNQGWAFQGTGYENAAHGISRGGRAGMFEEEKTGMSDEANTGTSEEEKYLRAGFEKGNIIEKANQKRKLSDNIASDSGTINELGQIDNVVKKAKKKAVNVWAKSSSRKGPKKNSKNGAPQNPSNEDSVLLTPVYVNPDKLEDGPDQPIALSKYDKAEKIELSENRLTASSTKGYRMVRATRGVQDGTWYFEIVVEQLGPTGHTRLGWSTQKGDVQAPVGFDSNSYGYRDLDGSKTHVAIREPYGDLYVEGDVIGFYINLPNGAEYAPKPAPLLSYRGRPYLSDIKEEQPRKVPGSEICFFRNGVCQGTAFRDINAGRYFPAASMYTLPKEPSCIVRFNFGPEFRFPPVDIGDRPVPMAMVVAPYHNALNGKEVGTVAWANVSATGNASLNNEPQIKIV